MGHFPAYRMEDAPDCDRAAHDIVRRAGWYLFYDTGGGEGSVRLRARTENKAIAEARTKAAAIRRKGEEHVGSPRVIYVRRI